MKVIFSVYIPRGLHGSDFFHEGYMEVIFSMRVTGKSFFPVYSMGVTRKLFFSQGLHGSHFFHEGYTEVIFSVVATSSS